MSIDTRSLKANVKALGGARRRIVTPSLLVWCSVFLFWVLAAVIAEFLVPHDPYQVDLSATLMPPSMEYWFGTDSMGRDVFSRVMVGSRDILLISASAAVISTLLGVVIGLLSGYFERVADMILSRIGEAMIAIPTVIFALLVIAALGRSPVVLVLVIALINCWVVGRTIRSAVLHERQQDYVFAAQALGESNIAVMGREILPNVLPTVIVELTVRMAYSVFAVANLSFLGFGIQPPSADWGLQIAESYTLLVSGYWWPLLFPTLAIASLVIAVYLGSREVDRILSRRQVS